MFNKLLRSCISELAYLHLNKDTYKKTYFLDFRELLDLGLLNNTNSAGARFPEFPEATIQLYWQKVRWRHVTPMESYSPSCANVGYSRKTYRKINI